MSSRNQVVMAGAIAVAVALAAIAGAVYLLPSPTTTTKQTGASGTSTVGALGGASTSGQGELAILLTDPPMVPAGVTAIYVTYSNVAVHVGRAGNQTGWTNANVTGTLNLMKMVNVSSTIATVKVSTGVYNALRFNVSSAQVTYNGANYTAFVPKAELTVVIPGGIAVNATSTAGAIIDMHPTVLNIGSKSTPEFIVDTAASAFGLPPGTVTKAIQQIGNRMSLGGQGWWRQISENYTADIQITGASVTNDSLSVTVKNTGTQNVTISTISLAPVGSECAVATNQTPRAIPLCFTGSAVFLVQSNSSLKSVSVFIFPPTIVGAFGRGPNGPNGGPGGPNGNQRQSGNYTSFSTATRGSAYPGSTGYSLAAGQSVTLSYSGAISFGFAFAGRSAPGVQSGDQYQITAVGQEALAETVVTAG